MAYVTKRVHKMTILPFTISLCKLNPTNRYKYALNVTLHLACTQQTNLLDSSSSFFNSLSSLQLWLHLRRTPQSNSYVAMAAKSYLVIPTANSVTTVVTLASSPFLAPFHFPVSVTLYLIFRFVNFDLRILRISKISTNSVIEAARVVRVNRGSVEDGGDVRRWRIYNRNDPMSTSN